MAYVSLYRRYRSQSFAELLGQQHITTVLQNAIRMGRISHAYLFCGPRGCGKTSTARLLARALNCQASDGPTPEPCGACAMCERIRDGDAIDVVEMDAASETGIDDVREKIIENARYSPAEARFKVYIIDEVHDLSAKAFDSLLKTIEEPPAHVVFILATTESHKVPITIRSRCQRLDFRRGGLVDLTANIERCLRAEGWECDPDAVAAIARAAEGSFRDSLSMLEQVMAFADGRIVMDAVQQALGTIGYESLDAIMRAVAADNMAEVFEQAQALVAGGADPRQALVALQSHARDLLVIGTPNGRAALGGLSSERIAALEEQRKAFTPAALLRMIEVLGAAEKDLRFTNQHRLVLERALWSLLPSMTRAAAQAPPTPMVQGAPQMRAAAPEPPSKPEVAPPVATKRALVAEASLIAEAQPQTADSAFAAEVDLAVLRRVWPNVRRRILRRSRAAGGILGDEEIQSLEGHIVVVAFANEFSRGVADRPKSRQLLEEELGAELGTQGYRIRCVLRTQATPSASQAPPSETRPPVASAESFVGQVVAEFDGEVIADD